MRITPACAGNRIPSPRPERGAKDHPRLRGEQEYAGREKPVAEGSPPLARGTVSMRYRRKISHGITPACAGNSLGSALAIDLGKDHPRLRGEQTKIKKF